jgi:hypothetical protein
MSRLLRPAVAVAVLASAVGAGAVLAAEPGPACPAWTDPAGDAGAASGAVPVGDKDLDIVGAEIASSEDFFLGRITVAKLGASGPNPQTGTADEFRVSITVDGVAGELNAKRDTATGPFPAYLKIGPTRVDATAEYDLETSTVTIAATAADAAEAAGKPISGAVVVADLALAAAGTRDLGLVGYDEAPAPEGTTLKGFCTSTGPAPKPQASGSPAPSASGEPSSSASAEPSPSSAPEGGARATMSLSAPVRVAYSDALPAAVRITTESGTGVGGKQVTAEFAGARVARRTGADGRAAVPVPALKAAGAYTLTARWAGDAETGPASATRRAEIVRERVAIRISPGTAGGRHVASISVRDDDGAVLRSGGVVTVFVDGARKGTVRLDSAGRATWPARAGSAVTVDYPGATGTYLPARGSSRV